MFGGVDQPEIETTPPEAQLQTLKKGVSPLGTNLYFKMTKKDPVLAASRANALEYAGTVDTAQEAFELADPYYKSIVEERGALPADLQRFYDQQALGAASDAGMAKTNTAIAKLILNSSMAREARMNSAVAARQGAISQLQGSQINSQNMLNAAEAATTAKTSALLNPLAGFVSAGYGQETEAAIAEAGLAQRADIENANKWSEFFNTVAMSTASMVGGAMGRMGGSDERIKTNIKGTGIRKDGVEYKTFEYLTRPGVLMLGPMAQDVERKAPSAVQSDPYSGIKFVDTRRFPIIQLGRMVA